MSHKQHIIMHTIEDYCRTGNVSMVKAYFMAGGFMNLAFLSTSILYNQLAVIKLIYRVYPIVFTSNHVDMACQYGHLNIATWFFSVGLFPEDEGVRICIEYNRIEIMAALLRCNNRIYQPYYVDLAIGYDQLAMAHILSRYCRVTSIGHQLYYYLYGIYLAPDPHYLPYNIVAYRHMFENLLINCGKTFEQFMESMRCVAVVAA